MRDKIYESMMTLPWKTQEARTHFEHITYRSSIYTQLLRKMIEDRIKLLQSSPKKCYALGDFLSFKDNHPCPLTHLSMNQALPDIHAQEALICTHIMPWLNQDIWHTLSKAMAPESILWIQSFGPNTLKEYRLLKEQDTTPPSDQHDKPQHTPFIDMHDLADAARKAGFNDPVFDQFEITLDADNFDKQREEWGLTCPFEKEYFNTHTECNTLSIELIMGQCWGPENFGAHEISIDDIIRQSTSG